MHKVAKGALLAAGILVILTLGVAVGYALSVRDVIYPGVAVGGIDVGGLTASEAAAVLQQALPDPQSQTFTVHVGSQAWTYTWTALGKGFDYPAMAAQAYAAGREGAWLERQTGPWQVRFQGRDLPLYPVPADPTKVAQIVDIAADAVFRAPAEATLELRVGTAMSAPGEPGQELDREAARSAILTALESQQNGVALSLSPIPPRISSAEPSLDRAQRLLSQPFVLRVDDVLTAFQTHFEASPEQVATWFEVETGILSGAPALVLRTDLKAIEAWLADVGAQLEPDRILDLSPTFVATLKALAGDQHEALATVRHPEGRYIVQPGDALYDIAYSFGFPQWRFEEANPDIDPGNLAIGQELVVPSIDVLAPEPIVRTKRIEIDLPAQTLRAYEDGVLLFEFRASSGMSSTPTIAGTFQVLMKEEAAEAERWSLEMPYFMGIYKEGPDFYNGIHALPINPWGYRLSPGVLGWPASFGCIILDTEDARQLFEWAPIGTLVAISGVAPGTPFGNETLDQIVDNPP
ncbi:MAG: L,D-transpeptidase family protein [Anaerolineae bacterium]|nr:L,D-transpeptidase family protein [Anaerolineae bacterium]